MEMCYDGALVMPSSYAVMDEEEMSYVEGGGIYINNSQLRDILAAYLIAYSTAPKIVAAGTIKVCKAISSIVGKFTSWVGRVLGGVAGSFVGWAIGAYCGWELAKNVVSAMVQGKGLYIGWGFSVK